MEKENNAKHQKRSENIETAREYEKQTYHKHKASNPEQIRELNRKAQNSLSILRKAMQGSNLNQTEIAQGQESIKHSMAKVIQSFQHKITNGPEYIFT